MTARRSDRDRRRLKELDACLAQLEDANERDEQHVSPAIASLVGQYVPSVTAGMAMPAAIELVLGEQERYLRSVDSAPPVSRATDVAAGELVEYPAGPLDESEARELTERIRQAIRQVCMLLLEAHQRRAWTALGYRTWEQYVHTEFGLSRSRSYQLLDQGYVILTIRSSAGLTEGVDIHPSAAAQLKPRLAEIVEIVRSRTAGRTEDEAREIVREVIRSERSASRRQRRAERAGGPDGELVEPAPLYEAVAMLARMPRVADVVASVPERAAHQLDDLELAVSWLNEFNHAWAMREPDRERLDPADTARRTA